MARRECAIVQVSFEVFIFSDIKVYVFPPHRGRGGWLARTVGGTKDPDPWDVTALDRETCIRQAKAAARYPAFR